jgi:hypothetical protein
MTQVLAELRAVSSNCRLLDLLILQYLNANYFIVCICGCCVSRLILQEADVEFFSALQSSGICTDWLLPWLYSKGQKHFKPVAQQVPQLQLMDVTRCHSRHFVH